MSRSLCKAALAYKNLLRRAQIQIVPNPWAEQHDHNRLQHRHTTHTRTLDA